MIGVIKGLAVGCQDIEILGRVLHTKREALCRGNRKIPAPGALAARDPLHGIGQKGRIEDSAIQDM